MPSPMKSRNGVVQGKRLRRLIVEPTKSAPKSDGRLPGLDALRTASMVAVVAAHAAYAYG